MTAGTCTAVRARRAGIALLFLLLTAAVCRFFYNLANCIDGCGPYHNRSAVIDLDGDGDLDVIVSNLRHETENMAWAGATLWTNQGGGKFTSRTGDFGGPYTTAGDVDNDGDIDLLRWDNDAILIHTNYGQEDPIYSDFRVWYGVRPVEEPSHRSYTTSGSIALGDLNGDGRLDAFVSNWGASLFDQSEDFPPYLAWVWINTPDETTGYPKNQGLYLSALGNLPMQATLGDFDGDGDLDVYAASLPPKGGNYDPADRILLNDGSGAFLDSGQRLDNPRKAGAAGSGSVSLGDLDGDGDLDALVATAKGAAVWMNQGGLQSGQAAVFAKAAQRLSRGLIEAVFLADLDVDGDLDALIGGKTQATIWWNDGQGSFQDSGQRLKYPLHHALAVGDYNNDRYLDLFTGASNGFNLWLNQGDGKFTKEVEL